MSSHQLIIFDLGNAVFHITFEPAFKYLEEVSGRSRAEIENFFYTEPIFEAFERKEVTPEQVNDFVNKNLGINQTFEEFEKYWNSIYLDPLEGIERTIQILKIHYKLAVLSNTNETHARVWKVRYANILKHFDSVFGSHDIGARKPEKAAYQTVLEHFNVIPEKAIFIDDKAENIEAANAMGINGIQITSNEQLITDLKKLGVLIIN